MESESQLIFTIVMATVLFLFMIAVVGMLLILNSNRRQKYRIEMAEMQLRNQKEVTQAEREATEQTLTAIGRELHDNIGQLLTVAQMGMMHPDIPDNPAVGNSLEAINQGIEEVRRLGRSLNSDTWKTKTLKDAVKSEAARIERTGQVKVHTRIDEKIKDLEPDSKTILFRCFQEVISNALRHSQADTITIELSSEPQYMLSVEDNGKGFDVKDRSAGSGLLNIMKRSKMIGFDAQVDSEPGGGCRWTFVSSENEVPISQNA